MKNLDTTFTQDNNVFTQIKRSDKAACYKRETLEGSLVSYEVFAIKTKNDAEIYPAKHAFGGVLGWAWCPISPEKAELYFDRLNKGEITLADVDPETGIVNQSTDDRSLDELPDVNVSTETVVAVDLDPTAPTTVETPVETPIVVLPTVDGGAVVTVAVVKQNKVYPALKLPNGEFTRTDFANLNGLKPCNSESYGALMREIKQNRVIELRKDSGKGKPHSVYTAKTVVPTVINTPTTV
jgi:hypothetical protein